MRIQVAIKERVNKLAENFSWPYVRMRLYPPVGTTRAAKCDRKFAEECYQEGFRNGAAWAERLIGDALAATVLGQIEIVR